MCENCSALLFKCERAPSAASFIGRVCCNLGRCSRDLVPRWVFPEFVRVVIDDPKHEAHASTLKNIRMINGLISFATVSIDKMVSVNLERSHFLMMGGSLYHTAYAVAARSDGPPAYSQLYFVEPDIAHQSRMARVKASNMNEGILLVYGYLYCPGKPLCTLLFNAQLPPHRTAEATGRVRSGA